MVSLHPDAQASSAVASIDAIWGRASSILGSTVDSLDAFNEYLSWSVGALHSLRRVLEAEDVAALMETTGFRLIHAANPGAYSRLALGELVRAELAAQIDRLQAIRWQLRDDMRRWELLGGTLSLDPSIHIGVLDTNVLMLHGTNLADLDWNPILDARYGEKLALVVPQMVIRELDRLKRSSGKMRVGQQSLEQRDLARRALRCLNRSFPSDETTFDYRRPSRSAKGDVISRLWLVLQIDDLRHEALADPDAEIIDRTMSLKPWGKSVTLVTADTSMRFRAEHAGVRATEPDWDPPATQ